MVSFPSSVQIANAKKAKRGPSVKLFGDEMCSICGRKADGFHYNVLSCQGRTYNLRPKTNLLKAAKDSSEEQSYKTQSTSVEPDEAAVT